jgi:hypothetical protein
VNDSGKLARFPSGNVELQYSDRLAEACSMLCIDTVAAETRPSSWREGTVV